MGHYDLNSLVRWARQNSPFYQSFYKDVPEENFTLEDLPILDKEKYWRAATPDNKILTQPFKEGIVLRSGGSTGEPKIALYTSEEWEIFVHTNARFLDELNLLKSGDRIANLYSTGLLYAGLLLMHDSMAVCKNRIIELPIGAFETIENVIKLCQRFGVTGLMGLPGLLINLADYVIEYQIKNLPITAIYYGGDCVLKYQRERMQQAFPRAQIVSDGYASADVGYLGFTDRSCEINEQRTYPQHTIIEIIDEEGLPIREMERAGRVVATNLTRSLMPAIRYPVGDKACWVEAEGTPFRKLRLLGRYYGKSEMIKVGKNVLLDYNVVEEVIYKSPLAKGVVGFQLVIDAINAHDQITINIATENKNIDIDYAVQIIKEAIYEKIPSLSNEIKEKNILPLQIKLISPDKMEFTEVRKISVIKDQRNKNKT